MFVRLLRSIPIIGLVVASAAVPHLARAEGVRAGTLISNTASASYNSGDARQTIESNEVQIRVDELLDVAVASQDGAPVPSGGNSVLTFRVTNTGNGPEAFVLTADPAVAGNPFDPAVVTLAVDSDGDGIYGDGDTIVANGAAFGSLDPDAFVTVFVALDTANAPDGQTARVELTARAQTGTGVPGTVFAGQGDGGGDAVAGGSGADDSATGAVVTSVASVSLQKSAAIADPFGGSEPVPGAVVTFEIVAQISGSGAIADLAITDAIPAGTTYRAGSLRLDAAGLTDAADGDAGQASAAGIAVQIGSAQAGTNPTVLFDVVID